MAYKSLSGINSGGGGGSPGGMTGQVQVNAGGGTFGGTSNPLFREVGITIDGGGSPPATGVKGYVIVPFSGTINSVTLISDVSGSCVIDVWKVNNAVPTVANTITAADLPTLSSQQLVTDSALTGWTTAVAANDVFGFNLNSASTLTRVTLELKITTN